MSKTLSSNTRNFKGLYWLIFNEIFTLTHIILIKKLVGDFSVFQIVFIRSLSSSIIILPFLFYLKEHNNILNSFSTNLIRVISSFIAISIQFFSISNIQLAQISTIGYLRPSILSIFAYFFLKEKQTKARWLVLLIGFFSVFLVFSPENFSIQIIAIIALIGVCCGSLSTIAQKFLSKTFTEIQLMVWYSLGLTILSLPFSMFTWQNTNNEQLFFMILTGLLATTAQYFFIKAYRFSQASFLAPIQYFHIIPILFIGYLIFNETPSIQTLLGATLIIISLFFLLIWEKIKSR